MKTHSDELFLLIKAMSPKEKLFLKAYHGNNPGNGDYSYFVLFDTLNKMKQYNETLLRSKLAKQGYDHNLDKAKNYLTKVILKSLTEYHSDSSVDTVLENLIFQAEILYKKRMNKMADKILQKAEKMALEYEKPEYLLMIYSLETNMALETSDLEKLRSFMESGMKKEKEYLKKYINAIDYRNLAVEISLLNQSPDIVSGDEAKNTRLKNLFESPLLEDSKSALSLSAKKHFYKLNYSRFFKYKTKWSEKPHRMIEEWVEYLEKGSLHHLPEVYIKTLSHYLVTLGKAGGQNKAEATFKKAQNFYASLSEKKMHKNIHLAFAHLMINYSYVQMLFFTPQKVVDKYVKLPDAVIAELDITAYFNIFWSYFFLEDYHEALIALNKILSTKSDFRKDLQAMSRLHLLFVHYELRNMDMFPYIAKSSERWLIKNDYLPKDSEKQLFDFFIYKLPKTITPDEEIKELSSLLERLKKLDADETEIFWLESKIQNRPMLDIAKENAKKTPGNRVEIK